MSEEMRGSVLVMGGGIAGMQSALDLADSGYFVHLVEKSPSIGGAMAQLDKTFPTNDCAMWIISPKLVEVGPHINIQIHPCSTVKSIEGKQGNLKVLIQKKPRYVDVDKCTGCGDCATQLMDENHPATEMDGRLWVDRIEIDEAKCIQCGDCTDACMEENPLKHALTTIVRKRFEAVETEGEIEAPTLLQDVLKMGRDDRKAFWANHFQKCIKCYGCIDVCPVQAPGTGGSLSLDNWVEKGHVPPPYPLFHMIRAYQVWDTCVLCGDCEQTCPAEIPLKMLQDMVRHFSPEEVFDLVPNLQSEARNAIIDVVKGG